VSQPPNEDRQSTPLHRQSLPSLTDAQKAQQEAANTLQQYDRMVELIGEAISAAAPFRLRPHVIQELNRISLQNIDSEAGRLRDTPMRIEGSGHRPPPAQDVPKHVDELCEYVSDNWVALSALHLAAYVM
jgi:Fic family protein